MVSLRGKHVSFVAAVTVQQCTAQQGQPGKAVPGCPACNLVICIPCVCVVVGCFRDTTGVDQDPKGHPVNTPLWRSSDGPVRPLGDAFIKACEHSPIKLLMQYTSPYTSLSRTPRRYDRGSSCHQIIRSLALCLLEQIHGF